VPQASIRVTLERILQTSQGETEKVVYLQARLTKLLDQLFPKCKTLPEALKIIEDIKMALFWRTIGPSIKDHIEDVNNEDDLWKAAIKAEHTPKIKDNLLRINKNKNEKTFSTPTTNDDATSSNNNRYNYHVNKQPGELIFEIL